MKTLILFILLLSLPTVAQVNSSSPDYYLRIDIISAFNDGYTVLLDQELEGTLSFNYYNKEKAEIREVIHIFELDLKNSKDLIKECIDRLAMRKTLHEKNKYPTLDGDNILLYIYGNKKLDNYRQLPLEYNIIRHLLGKHAPIKLDFNKDYTLQ